MAVEKFSISLPEGLVAEVDQIASHEGVTRSAVIREATADYVTSRKSAANRERRRERIQRAIDGFEDMANRWGPDEKTGLAYLKELRGESPEPRGR